jgi:hypothetical protein
VNSRWQTDAPVVAIPLFQVWCDDQLIAESRHSIWGGTLPFSAWMPGEMQSDSRPIHPPIDFTPGCLRLSVSLLVDGQAVAALDASGIPLSENRLWASLEMDNP